MTDKKQARINIKSATENVILRSTKEIEDLLEAKGHEIKRNMLDVYICTVCNYQQIHVFQDPGVTPVKMKCPKCNNPDTFESCGLAGVQPDMVWYRPKNIDELKEMVDQYIQECLPTVFENGIDENGRSMKEIRKDILLDFIERYNQCGLFLKKRV